MQTIIFYKRACILIALLFFAAFIFGQGQPKEKKNHFNIGLNYSRIILIPYLSAEYRTKEKFGITVEFVPVMYIPNYIKIRALDIITNGKYSDTIAYNGFLTNLIFYKPKPKDGKAHFIPAIELSVAHQSKRNYISNSIPRDNPCDSFSSDFNYITIDTRLALTTLLFYGKPHFKIFAGLGIGRTSFYRRGYHLYEDAMNSQITPFKGTNIYYKPVVKLGLRVGFDVF